MTKIIEQREGAGSEQSKNECIVIKQKSVDILDKSEYA